MSSCEEKKFLHDMASPVSTAILLTQYILENIDEGLSPDSENTQRIKKIFAQLEKLKKLIETRRQKLAKRSA